MNEVLNSLKTRRSVRAYQDTQVPDELLDQVLEAGLYAASGMNNQKVIMVAVRDKETRDLLSRMNAAVMGRDADPFYGAPCVIVVLGDHDIYPVVENGSLVLGNLMNAAHAVGLGSAVGYIGAHNRSEIPFGIIIHQRCLICNTCCGNSAISIVCIGDICSRGILHRGGKSPHGADTG